VTTKYTFDYRERAYYTDPKWNAYFFTWKKEYSEVCHDKTSFDCNMYVYSRVLPDQSVHSHHVIIEKRSNGFKDNVHNYGMNLIFYHQLPIPRNKQFLYRIPSDMEYRHEFYSEFIRCLHARHDHTPAYCRSSRWEDSLQKRVPRNLTTLVLRPFWKLAVIFGKHTGEVLDHFMTCDELPRTVYLSEGLKVCS